MKESELRAAVEERRTITDSTWAYLEDRGFVESATYEEGEAGEDPVGYLVEEIDRIWAAAPESSRHAMPTGGVPYSRQIEFLQEHERERAEARNEILAKHAAADESVLAFRDRFLDGEPLTPEQAQAFVTSLANQNMAVRWFEDHGVPFLGHTSHTRQRSIDHRGELIEFAVQPAGITCRVERHALSEKYGGGETLSVVGGPPDVIARRRNDVSLPTPQEVNVAQEGLLDLGYWRGFTDYVRNDSPLGALRDLGNDLTKRYRGWKRNYATRFVLTGEAPKIQPLVVGGQGSTFVMHVEPWISPESVKYTYTRELWFCGWMNEHYGGRKVKRRRRPGDKSLKLLRFVTDRIDHRGRRPNGREVAAQWDAAYPDWAYRGNTRRLWRDYKRTLQQVAPEAAIN